MDISQFGLFDELSIYLWRQKLTSIYLMQILTSKVDPRAERVNIASADVINILIISSSKAFEPDNDLHILISQCELKTKLMLPLVPAQQTRDVDPLLVQ